MNRRSFLQLSGTAAATAVLDPERLLWRPSRTFFLPPARPVLPSLHGLSRATFPFWRARQQNPHAMFENLSAAFKQLQLQARVYPQAPSDTIIIADPVTLAKLERLATESSLERVIRETFDEPRRFGVIRGVK